MQRELPIALVPMVMVVMNLVYALSAYPAGVLSDRLGRGGRLTVIDYRRIRPAPHGAMAARSMKGIAVNTRIQLLDVDRPGEIFEANLEEATPTRLALSVPNTIVRFDLYRQEGETAYSGSLGGRHYVFTPPAKARKSAASRG